MFQPAREVIRYAAAVFILCSGVGAWALPAAGTGAFETQKGRYFQWTAPRGWGVSESISGVTLTSPDAQYSAGLASLLRSQGSRTPQAFLQWVFASVPAYSNVRCVAIKNLPDERLSYQTWQFIEAVVSYHDKGLPVTGVWKVGVANYYGLNDAMIVGYRAANPVFQQAQAFMPQIARSIVLINGAGFAGNDTLIKPKNNPLDNRGLIESGKMRDRVGAHASEGWREGMMGTEPTIDRKTGQTYNSPLNSYNPARGGYVNPSRPDELLDLNHK